MLKLPLLAQSYPRRILKRLYAVARAAFGRESAPAVIKFPREVTVETPNGHYNFLCYSKKESQQAKRFFKKDPGTVEWLLKTLRPDDIFFDVGANTGAYSMFAAREISSRGAVYAFEPHVANAASLLQNVNLNGLAKKVQVVSVPLVDRDGFGPFHYHALETSRSHGQFGSSVLDGEAFNPVATEVKYGARLDTLIEAGIVPVPTIVRIDITGLDAQVIIGMKSLLMSPRAPRSILIQLNQANADQVVSQMTAAGYEAVVRHWTNAGQDAIREGADPLKQFPHNVVFGKVAVAAERRPPEFSLAQAG